MGDLPAGELVILKEVDGDAGSIGEGNGNVGKFASLIVLVSDVVDGFGQLRAAYNSFAKGLIGAIASIHQLSRATKHPGSKPALINDRSVNISSKPHNALLQLLHLVLEPGDPLRHSPGGASLAAARAPATSSGCLFGPGIPSVLAGSWERTPKPNHLMTLRMLLVKNKREKDKIETKLDKKWEAWRSQEKFKAVIVDKGRKTEQNEKRMAKNARTVKKLFKFKEKKKKERA
uniref:Uncharacterized protein n=1 Tax=Tanacetum cinerariifolium TaxID=118510 RepID=A0A699GZ48_TANCI|nr:hypothetical protein [Tanacetum cinerariifolium]